MFVKLVSFYFMNSIAVLSVMFSQIFADIINFCCNFRSVTHILKLNVSLFSSRISCNVETCVYGLVCMFAHRRMGLHNHTQFYFFSGVLKS